MNVSSLPPQLILYNGAVATEEGATPPSQALAIGGGRILRVGRNEDVLHRSGPETEKIDLEGRLVVPGFFDSHIHFYEWALKRRGINLEGLNRLDELLDLVREAAGGLTPGQWIIGHGWNETDWVEKTMPTRQVLDRAAPHHPILLWRCDLHLAVANTAALRLAGISADTADPPEGRIERDDAGEPTGILRELAINLARQAMAPPAAGQVVEAFEDAAKALHRRGVTAIHDIRLMADKDGARAFQAFEQLDRNSRLDLRCWVTLPGHLLDRAVDLGLRTGFGNDRLRVGHVKFFADGGMGARTAWLIDPYQDAERGMPLVDMAALAGEVSRADRAGLSVMVHAVGDRANRELIELFETLEAQRRSAGFLPPAIAHRIEHVQMIRPEDIDRLGKLELALCVTPANMVLDMNLIDLALGKQGQWTYAFRPLLDCGAPVMFSSDCPVCDPDPLVGMHAAVTRQRTDQTPQGGWYPENRVTTAEALGAYTAVPAAAHKAFDLGTVTAGKTADLAVLSDNILKIPPSQLPQVRVDMTVFDGRIVYRRQ